jgi:hypothetical protein
MMVRYIITKYNLYSQLWVDFTVGSFMRLFEDTAVAQILKLKPEK